MFLENLEDILEELPNAMNIYGETLGKLLNANIITIPLFVSLLDNYDISNYEKVKFVSVFLKNVVPHTDVRFIYISHYLL